MSEVHAHMWSDWRRAAEEKAARLDKEAELAEETAADARRELDCYDRGFSDGLEHASKSNGTISDPIPPGPALANDFDALQAFPEGSVGVTRRGTVVMRGPGTPSWYRPGYESPTVFVGHDFPVKFWRIGEGE